MGSLGERPAAARRPRRASCFGVRLHGFDAAVERALREWEASSRSRALACAARDERGRDQHRHRRAARGGVGRSRWTPSASRDWVTIHRSLATTRTGGCARGYEMEQTLCLRGVNFKVHWELVRCEQPLHAEWQGHGPARSHAETEYRLTADDGGGTHFDYRNEFQAPLGPLGRGRQPRARRRRARSARPTRSLRRLKALVERDGAADATLSCQRVSTVNPALCRARLTTSLSVQSAGHMTDFLEEKKREINARLKELRPLVDEYHRLEAAAAALDGVGSTAPPARRGDARGAGAARARAPSARPAPGRRGRPRGSGTRAKQALELVRTRPGITIPELAEAMGIQQNYLYRVLPGARRRTGWSARRAAAGTRSRRRVAAAPRAAARPTTRRGPSSLTASRSSLSSSTVMSIFDWAKSPTSRPSTIS